MKNILIKLYSVLLNIITSVFGVDMAKNFDTKLRFHRSLNLKNPSSLADKVSFLELHQQSPLASKCSDKWDVRKYVEDKGLSNLLVLSLGGPWSSFQEIDFDNLPDSFVLKATHGCKMNYIVTDKSKLNKEECQKEVNNWLNTTYGIYSMEPHYKTIPHRVYAEKYLGNMNELYDYKFHCMNGKPEFVLVTSDRKSVPGKPMEVKLDLFDLQWNHLDGIVGYKNETAGDGSIPKPKHLEEMIKAAEILSKDFKFVRVDLYDTDDGVMFGELTFSPACCVFPYMSEEFLLKEGNKLNLN